MTARRDLDAAVRAYLEDGPTELPDRSFDAVRNHIDHSRQRVAIGPWRFPQMTNFTRFGIAAAAVVAAAVVGLKLLPSQGPGGTDPTPTIASTPAPSATPIASAGPLALPIEANLVAGTYYKDETSGLQTPVRVTFTVPAGWTSMEGSFIYKDRGQPGCDSCAVGELEADSEVLFVTWVVTHIYTDACDWDDGSLVEIGSAPGDLISALARQMGRAETPGVWPWEGTVGGQPAEGVELEVPIDLDTTTCTNGILRYWPDPGPNFSGGFCCNTPGNRDFIYAVDVNGQTIAVVIRHYAESNAQDVAELDAILQSLQLQ